MRDDAKSCLIPFNMGVSAVFTLSERDSSPHQLPINSPPNPHQLPINSLVNIPQCLGEDSGHAGREKIMCQMSLKMLVRLGFKAT